MIKREQASILLDFINSRLISISQRERKGFTDREVSIYNELKRLKTDYPKELPEYNFSNEDKLYYLAGLIDGEGSVRITKAKHKMYGHDKLILVPQISIANTDKRLCEFLKKEFGGFFYEKKRFDKYKNIYLWFLQGNKSEFFNNLDGKLIIKQDRLSLIIEYLKSRLNNVRRTDREIDIFLKIRELNGKGKEKYEFEDLKKLTLITRSPRVFFAKKEELEDLYWNKEMSIRGIADMYKVTFNTIFERMVKHNIKRRTSYQEMHLLNNVK